MFTGIPEPARVDLTNENKTGTIQKTEKLKI